MVRYRLLDGAVSVLDERLQPIQRLVVDVAPTARLLAATPDLATVVVADTRSVIIMAAGRPTPVEIPAADSATLLPGGRLLVTAPRMVRMKYRGREYDDKGEHLVILVDLDSGHVLDEVELDAVNAGVHAVPHPYDGSVVLDAGEGQDGSLICVARVLNDTVQVERVAWNVTAASFAPSGDRLLLTRHPSFDNEISVLEWPSRRTIARLHADDLASDHISFDVHGCFLSDQRVLVAGEHELVLCSDELSPVGLISLNPPSETGDVEVSTVLGLAQDMFAAEIWTGNSPWATVWRIPSSTTDTD